MSVGQAHPALCGCAQLVGDLLAQREFWGPHADQLPPEFAAEVGAHLHAIGSLGVRRALEGLKA